MFGIPVGTVLIHVYVVVVSISILMMNLMIDIQFGVKLLLLYYMHFMILWRRA